MINAKKFESKGQPDFISMDANAEFLDFSRGQSGPKEATRMRLQGYYTFYRNKNRITEKILTVKVNWGDGETDFLDVNGLTQTIEHTYSAEGIYNIDIILTTISNKYKEYARAVSTTDPREIRTSGRIAPQKVGWLSDCAGTILNGNCYIQEIVEDVIRADSLSFIKIGPRMWSSPPAVYVHSYYSVFGFTELGFLSNSFCSLVTVSESDGVVIFKDVTTTTECLQITAVGLCPANYTFSGLFGYTCRRSITNLIVDPDFEIPASTYFPSNMEYQNQ